MSDHQLQRAEAAVTAVLAAPERRLRVNYSPAPTRMMCTTTLMPPRGDASMQRNDKPKRQEEEEPPQTRVQELEKELSDERRRNEVLRKTTQFDDERKIREGLKATFGNRQGIDDVENTLQHEIKTQKEI